jgi:hypothetical protein
MRPTKVNILGMTYTIEYCESMVDVDVFKRWQYRGQFDKHTHSIRVFDDGSQPDAEIWRVLVHEILHGIVSQLHIQSLDDSWRTENGKPVQQHKDLDLLALGISNVLIDNNWIKIEEEEK